MTTRCATAGTPRRRPRSAPPRCPGRARRSAARGADVGDPSTGRATLAPPSAGGDPRRSRCRTTRAPRARVPGPRAARSMRGSADRPLLLLLAYDERDVVDVAPAPVLARLGRPDDRMRRLVRVLRRVLVGRVVAATDLAALHAHAQVHPAAAGLEAFLAAGDRVGQLGELDRVEMAADLGHRILTSNAGVWLMLVRCLCEVTSGGHLRTGNRVARVPRARRPRWRRAGEGGRVAARAPDHDGRRQPRRRIQAGALAGRQAGGPARLR